MKIRIGKKNYFLFFIILMLEIISGEYFAECQSLFDTIEKDNPNVNANVDDLNADVPQDVIYSKYIFKIVVTNFNHRSTTTPPNQIPINKPRRYEISNFSRKFKIASKRSSR
jgi:hypothetical protein